MKIWRDISSIWWEGRNDQTFSFFSVPRSEKQDFFACLIVNAAVALIGCLYQAYSLRPSGYEVSALGIFYSGFGGGMSLIGILSALTVSIFVGTKFTSGAMRNKVIVGSGRAKLYWCNLVTACALCVLIYAGYHLVNFTLGTAILGWGGRRSRAIFLPAF